MDAKILNDDGAPVLRSAEVYVATEELALANAEKVELDLVITALSAVSQHPWAFFAAKRLFDIVLASVLLILGLPFLLVVVVLIRIDSPGPIFFRQERVRQGLRRFWILKFRTMFHDTRPFPVAIFDAQSGTYRRPRVSEDPRLTRAGRILRRYSVDELPQILNILRGEMSFIGPRPLSVPESLLVPRAALMRYAVPSGITGIAQLRSRAAIVSNDRFDGDIEYVENLSVRQEVKVFFGTFSRLYDRTI